MSARPASSTCDHPFRFRHQRNFAGNPDSLPITTSQVVAHTISIGTMAQRKRGTQEATMGDWIGVLIGVVSSSLGGTGGGVTPLFSRASRPLTLVLFRPCLRFL